MTILKDFPDGFQPRPIQIKLLNDIEKAFKEYNIVICSAPTGTGKSFLAKTLSNSGVEVDNDFVDSVNSYSAYTNTGTKSQYQGTACLTITKALQEQYKELFTDGESLKGKSNYQCKVDPNVDVELGPCVCLPKIKKDCWSNDICPYFSQRNRSLTSKFSIYNYNMFMALPDHLKNQEYIICDEASEIEDQLVQHFSLSLNSKTLKYLEIPSPELPKITNYKNFYDWLVTLEADIVDSLDKYKVIVQSNTKTESAVSKYRALLRMSDKINLIINSWSECEYVLSITEGNLNIVPLYVSALSSEIFKYGKKILLMSATIIDPQHFAKSLGIERYKFVEAKSTFLSEKSPIHISNKFKLNYKNLQANLPKVTKAIQDICDFHGEEKGAIHTHTGRITDYLRDNLLGDRFLFRFQDNNNEKLILSHTLSELPTVVVSPSITHGVDFKDDLARFQIIVKLPYLPLGDARVKALFEVDSDWYTNKMLSTLVQSSGRGSRSQDDWCTTYILDGTAAAVINRSKNKIPESFLERIH